MSSIRIKQLELRIKLFKKLVFLALFFILTALFYSPVYAACDPKNPNPVDCGAGLQQIEDVFKSVISVIVGLGFIACLVMLVMAGIKYLTSGGEPKAVQQAHFTVTWALLGVLFLAVAWLILQLIHAFTGINVTIFDIKSLCKIPGSTIDFCSPSPATGP